MKKSFFAAAVIVMFVLSGCGESETQKNLRPVEYAVIKDLPAEFQKTFSGYVKAATISDLSFQIEGEITNIYVLEGQKVKRGQIIAHLDNTLYKIEMDENTMRVKDAIVKYDNAKSYYSRVDKLHAEGGISDNNWERAFTNMESARYQIKIARDMLAHTRKKVSYGTLKAPSDGTIVKKYVEQNQYVKPGDAIVQFQSNKADDVVIFVPQNYINQLFVGQGAKVTIEALPDRIFDAKIKSMIPTSINESAFTVKLTLGKGFPELKDGMSATVSFDIKSPQINNANIKIPINSVLQEGNTTFVWVIKDVENGVGTVEKTPVTTGALYTNYIDVTKGLSKGDMVVTKGAQEIQNGQKVKL